jgi:hypothetical protein
MLNTQQRRVVFLRNTNKGGKGHVVGERKHQQRLVVFWGTPARAEIYMFYLTGMLIPISFVHDHLLSNSPFAVFLC